jgi:hypothetical protein
MDSTEDLILSDTDKSESNDNGDDISLWHKHVYELLIDDEI